MENQPWQGEAQMQPFFRAGTGVKHYMGFPPREPSQQLFYDSAMKDMNTSEQQIRAKLSEVHVANATKKTAEKCVIAIRNGLDSLDTAWRVRVFGSFANGLCTRQSDLDVTCYKEDLKGEAGKAQASKDLRQQLFPYLEAHPDFEFVEDIWTARIPILKLRFEGILEVDLSCQNIEPLPNTQLLRAYVDLSPIVKPIVIAVKLWAKAAGVCGAKDRHLSSYSLALMAIYYLQVDPNIELPCLPTWAFSGRGGTPAEAKLNWSSNVTLTYMIRGFFNFYAYHFQWGEEVVAIHVGMSGKGRRSSRTDPAHSELRNCWAPRLHIADPFLLDRNLNCVLGDMQENTLYEAIRVAAIRLSSGQVPVGFDLEFRIESNKEKQPQTEKSIAKQATAQKEAAGPASVAASMSDVTITKGQQLQSALENESASTGSTRSLQTHSLSPSNSDLTFDTNSPKSPKSPKVTDQTLQLESPHKEQGKDDISKRAGVDPKLLDGGKKLARGDKIKGEVVQQRNRDNTRFGSPQGGEVIDLAVTGKSTDESTRRPHLSCTSTTTYKCSLPLGVYAPPPESVPMTLLQGSWTL